MEKLTFFQVKLPLCIPWPDQEPQEPSCESSPNKTVKDSRTRTLHHVRFRCQVVSSRDHTTLLAARFVLSRLGIECSGKGHRRGENEHCGIMISLLPNCFGLSIFKKLDFTSFVSSVWPPLFPGSLIQMHFSWICIYLLDDVISISFTLS